MCQPSALPMRRNRLFHQHLQAEEFDVEPSRVGEGADVDEEVRQSCAGHVSSCAGTVWSPVALSIDRLLWLHP
jgi:hypothetical protein